MGSKGEVVQLRYEKSCAAAGWGGSFSSGCLLADRAQRIIRCCLTFKLLKERHWSTWKHVESLSHAPHLNFMAAASLSPSGQVAWVGVPSTLQILYSSSASLVPKEGGRTRATKSSGS